MATITIEYEGRLIPYRAEPGLTVLAALQEAGIDVSFPCGGNRTCGKCRVEAEGALTPLSDGEARLLGDAGVRMRLACFAAVAGDCRVKVLPPQQGGPVAADFKAAGVLDPIYDGGYGVAVDLGTTTVAAYLFAHDGPEPLAVCGEMNRQQAFGADVLSRIAYCNRHGVKPLSGLIRKQLADLANGLCAQARIPREQVRCFCVTGNTVMLHLLAGLDPAALAVAPFTPVSLFGSWADWRVEGFDQAAVYLPPCVSAYVGADITCSILASGIAEQADTVLLADLGTNGEIVLRTPERLVCCSTAAGPAFEGAGISSGSGAVNGAISAVAVAGGGMVYTVIGKGPARSVCGSGLIDAVYAMRRLEVIDGSGRMAGQYRGVCPIGDSGVSLTQADVRAFQLAKAAIRGGIDTLLHDCGVHDADLSRILLCGGFGSNIAVGSAEGVGLIPPGLARKTVAIGNAAGAGAGQILQSKPRCNQAQRIAGQAETLELSRSKFFARQYLRSMGFGLPESIEKLPSP